MHPPLNNKTKKFWEEVHKRKAKYPFWVKTAMTLQPPQIVSACHPFCRIPAPDFHLAVWGFGTSEALHAFISHYSGESWSPK